MFSFTLHKMKNVLLEQPSHLDASFIAARDKQFANIK